MFRKATVVLILALVSASVVAEERRTLGSGDANARSGGFGGPEIQVTRIGNKDVTFYGGKGGYLINGKYYIGGAGYGSTLNGSADSMAYAGLLFGRMFAPNSSVHFSADVVIGRGTVYSSLFNSDAFSIIEPGIDVSFNLSKIATLNIGMTQKYVTGDFGSTGYTANGLSKNTFRINVLFGSF